MKQVTSTNDYSILRKIQILHAHTQPKESYIPLERTIKQQIHCTYTSYDSSQFCKSFNMMAFRRASTKEDINNTLQGKNSACTQETLAISNLNFINPSSYIEMNQLQLKVWKSLQKQMLQKVYSIDIIVLLQNLNEYEFKFDISKLSCFLMVKELQCSHISVFINLHSFSIIKTFDTINQQNLFLSNFQFRIIIKFINLDQYQKYLCHQFLDIPNILLITSFVYGLYQTQFYMLIAIELIKSIQKGIFFFHIYLSQWVE